MAELARAGTAGLEELGWRGPGMAAWGERAQNLSTLHPAPSRLQDE